MTMATDRRFSAIALNPEPRKRAPRVDRPIDPDVESALQAALSKFAGHWLKANPAVLGIISDETARQYGFDLTAYDSLALSHPKKYASFFTVVRRTNAILLDYAGQDLLPLTLRQIHYQMVTRHKDHPNDKTSYNHLKEDLADARMWGLVPWNGIDDPTRNLHDFRSWSSAAQRLAEAADTHHHNRWANQHYRPLLLVEKDAVLGVISKTCEDYDVPYLSCKGYGSLSALRSKVSQHCVNAIDEGKTPVVIHMSDHDPTGSDMERNLREKVSLFVGQHIDIRHIALTPEQIIENELLPDPMKVTDPRAAKYSEKLSVLGLPADGSWEMDALSPALLRDLIVAEIDSLRDADLWAETERIEKAGQHHIRRIASNWTQVYDFLSDPLPCQGEMA